MVIDMNEAQIGMLELVRQVLDATAELEFKQAANDAHRYAWIEAVLRRFNYRGLGALTGASYSPIFAT
jgi:hypothetical protein